MNGFKWWILILCLFFSCSKKQEDATPVKPKTNLPHYADINFKTIFSPQDNTLAHEDSIRQIIENYYQTIWDGSKLSGGFLVAKGNHILFERYRGYGREQEQMPITHNTPMHIASISKTMTAMAIMKLIEAKKINLHQKVTHFFPKFPYAEVEIIHLLNQRSGIPKYEHFLDHLTPKPKVLEQPFLSNQNILDLLIQYQPPLARPTNTGFMYCNTNYALLALIVEQVTHKKFPVAMHEMLFESLGMDDTYIFQERNIPTAAQSFYYKDTKLYPLNNLDLIYGDKNVYTTPRDLLKFSQAMYAPNFLTPELMQQVFTPYSNEKDGVNNYGLGFRMKVYDNGEKLIYHTGWWHGSNAIFIHLLKSKTTIIAIGNRFSRSIYSAMTLSGLFEDFPFEVETFNNDLSDGDIKKLSQVLAEPKS
ncbi:serine hydrolase domain-containing protein [Riemerella columbina]|uniref:serine hydrolase domain-containing protein n=1 Tax=Riemerella columbina TaxID=103810 RepID=UPI00035F42EA|nr:serine hydrolase domain-containing protein [Riemerella columbina]